MALRIFINYRRDDERSMAARLRDRLATVFGAANIFMDVDNLRAGQRFDRELDKALAHCDVFLALIGPRWVASLKARHEQRERDYVCEEIAAALARNIPVVPVLLERTPLPRAEEVPGKIRELLLHQKFDITHESFGRDIEALVEEIKAFGAAHGAAAGARSLLPRAAAAVVVLGLVAGAVAFGTHYLNQESRQAGDAARLVDAPKVAAADFADRDAAAPEPAPQRAAAAALSDGAGQAEPAARAPAIVARAIDAVLASNPSEPARGWLGVKIQNVEKGEGARVTEVYPGGPGAKAGLRVGDIVVKIDGRSISDARNLASHIAERQPKTKVAFEIWRAESTR